jgi:pimeloyl-ACP methyl ester carboxylesterase
MATAEVNGFWARYEERGQGEPVVFVHGGFASFGRTLLDPEEDEWEEWEYEFAGHFRFVTYDRRGCGRSSCPPEGYGIENQARDLAALLDRLGLASAHLVGSSAGGPIALAFAALYPQRARSMVLVGTGVDLFRSDESGSADAIVKSQIALLEERGPEVAFENRPAGIEVWLEPLWMAGEAEERGELEQFLAREERLATRAAQAPVAERIAYYAVELRNIQAYVDCDGRDFARNVKAPTLVVHGERDQAVPVDWGVELAQAIPDAELHVINGASHGLLWRSSQARHMIIDFIARGT